jgi:hypothetical protein
MQCPESPVKQGLSGPSHAGTGFFSSCPGKSSVFFIFVCPDPSLIEQQHAVLPAAWMQNGPHLTALKNRGQPVQEPCESAGDVYNVDGMPPTPNAQTVANVTRIMTGIVSVAAMATMDTCAMMRCVDGDHVRMIIAGVPMVSKRGSPSCSTPNRGHGHESNWDTKV